MLSVEEINISKKNHKKEFPIYRLHKTSTWRHFFVSNNPSDIFF